MVVIRKVVKAEYEMPDELTISGTLTTLDCGHVIKGAPHFSLSKVGNLKKCWQCECDQQKKS